MAFGHGYGGQLMNTSRTERDGEGVRLGWSADWLRNRRLPEISFRQIPLTCFLRQTFLVRLAIEKLFQVSLSFSELFFSECLHFVVSKSRRPEAQKN